MAESTVTYGIANSGWTSFHSYLPEWMIGMNSNFYTFKGGNMWKHYNNNTRNNYYGVQYTSKITPVFNDNPTENKMFKTISLESNAAWKTTVTTDQSSGFMEASYYQLKEGDYYAYIRRVAGSTDLDLMSAQGIGNVTTVTTSVKDSGTTTGTTAFKLIEAGQNFVTTVSVGDTVNNTTDGTTAIVTAIDSNTQLSIDCDIMVSGETYTINATTLAFNFTLDSIISIGDTIYFGATPTLGGTITAIDRVNNVITISLTSDGSCGNITGTAPVNGDYILYLKNAQAESYGARGYYMETLLENDSTSEVELFAIFSEVFKSFP
ncbi:MAG: putative structural protein [Prokaryotic dsDNA virus sp.]|nr:MAG: putative structural protein [Prokaryotic dsDNA virus sp.]|tara:strand:+ start:4752 stop:5714 length:963 start_codon:yes stop_codon:yes gene_type:complete